MSQANYWNQKIHKEIPATLTLGLEIIQLDVNSISVKAPLDKNINGHQTAFAGSIFTLGITTGWTLISNHLHQQNIPVSVVAGQAQIRYRKPIANELFAWADLRTSNTIQIWKNDWQQNRSAKENLIIYIGSPNEPAAELSATFYIKKL